jgi:hypothetical protein
MMVLSHNLLDIPARYTPWKRSSCDPDPEPAGTSRRTDPRFLMKQDGHGEVAG